MVRSPLALFSEQPSRCPHIRTDEIEYLPSWVVQTFNQFIALEKETRNSAFFNVTAAMNLWTNDLVAAATSRTDFDIARLRKEPTAIFIGCSVAQLDVLRPIIKMLVQQIHDVLMASMPGPEEPHQVLVMIDEFRQLGKMDSVVSKLTINAGYGFRMVLILQDLAQLDELYGKPTRLTTVSACQVKLFIRMNDLETSEYVSEMLGTTTIEVRAPIIRGGQGIFASRDKSVSYQERPLRLPEELRQMSSERAIVLVPNAPGFELRKLIYYRDGPYKTIHDRVRGRRTKVPPLPVWTDRPLLSVEQVRASAGPGAGADGVIALTEPEPNGDGRVATVEPTAANRVTPPVEQVEPPAQKQAASPMKSAGLSAAVEPRVETSQTENAPEAPSADKLVVLRPGGINPNGMEDRARLPGLTSRTAASSAGKARSPVRFERRAGNNPIRISDLLAATEEAIAKSEAELVPAAVMTPAVQDAVEKVRRKVQAHRTNRSPA